ncbi:MAG: NUDIX hydrolase [Aurantibacter sp.]
MDERIDILDSEGNFTGKTALKSEAHKKGLFHPTVHIWFYTSDGKVLLQQRGEHKNTHPLLWDVSVAGHIGAGEPVETAAIREVEEEIGLSISKEDLQKIGVFPSFFEHSKDLIDNEFHHSFLCELKVSLESLKKQEDEVEDLDLIRISKFWEELNNKELIKKYVPHPIDYYATIISEITNKLK